VYVFESNIPGCAPISLLYVLFITDQYQKKILGRLYWSVNAVITISESHQWGRLNTATLEHEQDYSTRPSSYKSVVSSNNTNCFECCILGTVSSVVF
jgi:hypothetical protein